MGMELNAYIGYNIYRAGILFRRELIGALRDYRITPEQWQTLVTLWNKSPRSMTEISEVTLQDLPSLSRMAVRMENNGWIQRTRLDSDKRVQMLDLTLKGKELEGILPPLVLGHFNNLLRSIPGKKQKEILQDMLLIRKLLGDTGGKGK